MRQLVWPVADTMVWLDLPRWVVLPRVIRRTLKRAVTREELWNGNKEPISTFIDPRPDRNVILWSIIKHGAYRRMFEQARSEIDTAHLRLYRLNSAGEARRFVEGVPVQ
jgi:adenylate kinase family enzyme